MVSGSREWGWVSKCTMQLPTRWLSVWNGESLPPTPSCAECSSPWLPSQEHLGLTTWQCKFKWWYMNWIDVTDTEYNLTLTVNLKSLTFEAMKPLPPDTRLSSETLAPASIACFSAVGTNGTSLRFDLGTSIKQLPFVDPEWWRLRRLPTMLPSRAASPGTTTTVSTCGRVNTFPRQWLVVPVQSQWHQHVKAAIVENFNQSHWPCDSLWHVIEKMRNPRNQSMTLTCYWKYVQTKKRPDPLKPQTMSEPEERMHPQLTNATFNRGSPSGAPSRFLQQSSGWRSAWSTEHPRRCETLGWRQFAFHHAPHQRTSTWVSEMTNFKKMLL